MGDDLGGDFQLGPVEARVEIGGAGIAIQDLRRHLSVRRVLAGLADQYFVGAASRQAVGEDGAGGPAADDDVVVGHGSGVLPVRASLRGSASPVMPVPAVLAVIARSEATKHGAGRVKPGHRFASRNDTRCSPVSCARPS